MLEIYLNKKVYSKAGKFKEKGFDTRAESDWHSSAGKFFPVSFWESPEQRNPMSLTKEGGLERIPMFLHLKWILFFFLSRFTHMILEIEISYKTIQQYSLFFLFL